MTQTINYINKKTGEEKIVTSFLSMQGMRSFCTVGRGEEMQTFKTLKEAEEYLHRLGFEEKGFYDADGALRHYLSRSDLIVINKALDRLIANCTRDEAESYRESFIAIKTLIHQQEQER